MTNNDEYLEYIEKKNKESNNMKISRSRATDLIHNSKGKVFGVKFVKRTTGETRNMSARLGVQKYVTGEGLKFSPSRKNLVTVFDMNKKGYRMVNLEGLTNLNINKNSYEVV
jgi:alkyl hydroperoxide reductase subunit AhpF